MENIHIGKSLENEFVGQIIDIFEDFLAEREININNPNRGADEDAAIIYGEDYFEIENRIMSTLRNWDLIN